MTSNLKDVPPWMSEMHRQLVRGRAVILYGNIQDYFLIDSRSCTLSSSLEQYFRMVPYQVVARYDIADGVQMLDEAMRSDFESLSAPANWRATAQGPAYNPGQLSSQSNSRGAAPSETTAGSAPQRGLELREPSDAFPRFRRLMGRSDVASAVIIFHGERFTGDSKRFDANERSLMVLLVMGFPKYV